MQSKAEAYAEKHGTLMPEIRERVQPFFPSFDLEKVRVKIVEGKESITGSRVWVLGNTIRFTRGAMDYPVVLTPVEDEPTSTSSRKFTTNQAIDLHTITGMGCLVHEVCHVWQYYRSGWLAMVVSSVQGLLRGLTKGVLRYSHDDAPMEREAMALELRFFLTGRILDGERYV